MEYKETFEWAPEGYTLNNGHIPHFHIPCGNGLSRLAKWIKLNNDGMASGFTNTDGLKSMPHIIDLCGLQQAHSTSESCFLLARASKQVEKLKNIPHKPQATCRAWKHKSSGHGCPV